MPHSDVSRSASWSGNIAAFDLDHSLWQAFARQVTVGPDRVAVTVEDRHTTYGELHSRVSDIAALLRLRGASRGTVVGICLSRSVDMVAAVLAVLRVGATHLPVDASHPRDRIRHMLRETGTSLILTGAATTSGLTNIVEDPHDLVELTPDLIPIDVDIEEYPDCSGDPTYVIYTSGSTGTPKGVQVPRRALANLVRAMQANHNLGPSDTWLSITSLTFDIVAAELYLPLLSGGRIVLATEADLADPGLLRDLLSRLQPTVMQATPSLWQLLVDAGWEGSAGLTAITGGEPLPRRLAEALCKRTAEVWNYYGPTETTVWSTCARLRPGLSTPVIGHPLANTLLYVVDETGELVSRGESGELCIGGAGLALGYVARPDLTAERFVPNPFHPSLSPRMYKTGDLVRYDDSGALEYLGRIDNQVKIRGHRIELGEIEEALVSHPSIRAAVVTVRQHPDESRAAGGQKLVAHCVSPQPAIDAREIRAYLSRKIPHYMMPAVIRQVESIPLTASGKTDRRRLAEDDLGRSGTPRTPSPLPSGPGEGAAPRLDGDTDYGRPKSRS